MPNNETFNIKPIRDWIFESRMMYRHQFHNSSDDEYFSIDPFAGNSGIAQLTNDLNPMTTAELHMDALEFLQQLPDHYGEVVFFDPPYSLRQLKECYDGIGTALTERESKHFFSDIKNEIARITRPGGIVLSFGWNSCGMGKTRGFEIIDILIVCHGGNHNDTICVREVKI